MEVIHLIASVWWIILYLLPGLECILLRLQHWLNLPQLLVDLLLSMWCDSILPVRLLPLSQRDRVDCVDRACKKDESRHVHVQDFLKRPRVPEVYRLGSNFDQEHVVYAFLELFAPWDDLSLPRLLLNVVLYVAVVFELGVLRPIRWPGIRGGLVTTAILEVLVFQWI